MSPAAACTCADVAAVDPRMAAARARSSPRAEMMTVGHGRCRSAAIGQLRAMPQYRSQRSTRPASQLHGPDQPDELAYNSCHAHRDRRRSRGVRAEGAPRGDAARLGHDVDDHGTAQRSAGRLPADLRRRRPRGRRAARADRGIVIGGSGQGEQIAANKVVGVRAALCNDLYTARLSREHNDANVLAIGGRIVASGSPTRSSTLWLTTPFEGGRHQRRIDQIADIERQRTRGRHRMQPCQPQTEPRPLAHARRDRSRDRARSISDEVTARTAASS